eukprot:8365693-Lingulodinium_polyedra.AAC.1
MASRSASMAECDQRKAHARPTGSGSSARITRSCKGTCTYDTAGSNHKRSSHKWGQYRSSDIPP